ncbi:hypothetical protein DNHGIG_19920 [Collibacillus ludicampi]|uniref:Uncharacterized protein n=1 Tax=Collibacillus ludicampi TaxID=2771369 RepID=A0AAV4LFE5_9BACL|nr:hypothetical protein [Collibacillus ludicampi]GIM46443.1 hypothetical protein DNHGIG_19920 [Collibacillus ludicampi]
MNSHVWDTLFSFIQESLKIKGDLFLYFSKSGLRTLTFQIDSEYSLKETVSFFKQNGIHAEMKTDAQPGIPELVELSDIDGNLLHFYIEGKTVSHGSSQIGRSHAEHTKM